MKLQHTSNITMYRFIKAAFMAALFVAPQITMAQDAFSSYKNMFTTPDNYVVKHTAKAPVIDGNIDEATWQQAEWTTDFVDIEGDLKPKPPLQTNIKMLWDDSTLYIAARLKDPQVWATLKKHDEVVFRDNDFELFIDPDNTTHRYYEIEVNALNTIFDLFLTAPYRDKGAPIAAWEALGMRTAVQIQGTVNNTKDTDKGWTAEMAIPFKCLRPGFSKGMPHEGTIWRINFSRVEYDTKIVDGKIVKLKDESGRDLPEHNWVWSPQGIIAMHAPERWGYLQFTKRTEDDVKFEMPYAELQKKYLWLLYYRQKDLYGEHRAYATSLGDLGLDSKLTVDGKSNTLKIDGTTQQFIAYITDDKTNTTYTINQDGFVQPLNYQHHE